MNKPVSSDQDGIAGLLQGVRSFRNREYGDSDALMPRLAGGQQPKAMMIACADSRIDPALIFGTRPGDLFVVRVVANLVPPPDTDGLDSAVLSAVEVGLQTLNIPHLIVCGHSGCAGIKAALDCALCNVEPDSSQLQDWASVAEPACLEVIDEYKELPEEQLARPAEQRSILKSLENLRARPWLREREARGEVTLHGWWFDIPTGNLWIADPQTGIFKPHTPERE